MLRRPVTLIASALSNFLGAVVGLGDINPHRIYGPRVTTDKNIGRSYGLDWVRVPSQDHIEGSRVIKRQAPVNQSVMYAAITAREAPTKRECIRRRRQAQRINSKRILAVS